MRKWGNGLTLDETVKEYRAMEIKAGEHTQYLDADLKEIQKVDNKIEWFKEKTKELEKDKQVLLNRLSETFDLAMVHSHSLPNGFAAKVDNKFKCEINDSGKFLKWLKVNCEPHEVLEFFQDSLKVTKVKDFCSKQINKMKINGYMEHEIKIDGIEFSDLTFRRLTTIKPKGKK